jgi:hypothetical protein
VRSSVRRPGAPPVIEPEPRSPFRTTAAVVGGGIAVILIAVLLITQVFGGDSGSGGSSTPTTVASTTSATDTAAASTGTSTSTTPAATAPVRADYTVYVLNSTQTNGAAATAANLLETSGYRIAGKGQAVTQTMAKTVIAYQQGSKRAAVDVAKLLGLTPASVAPATQNDIVAGQNAKVVVTLGADAVK